MIHVVVTLFFSSVACPSLKQCRELLVVSYFPSPAGHTQENRQVNPAEQRAVRGSAPARFLLQALRCSVSQRRPGWGAALGSPEEFQLSQLSTGRVRTPTNDMLSDSMGFAEGSRALNLLTGIAVCIALL